MDFMTTSANLTPLIIFPCVQAFINTLAERCVFEDYQRHAVVL